MYPNRDVRTSLGWPRRQSLAVHQWEFRESHGRPGLEVRRRAGAHSASKHRQRPLGAASPRDVLLFAGGDALYLCHWMRQSGLADLLPSLQAVYVGLSAGSMVMAPNTGEFFVGWTPPTGGDETLSLVDFAIFPHLDHEMLLENNMAAAEIWAAGMQGQTYAIDDQTAIKVIDGAIKVVSEGNWKYFSP